MASLRTITDHLDKLLEHDKIGDYPGAHNGLQIENSGAIKQICAAVDACEAVFQQATTEPGTLLLVHHGMLWNGAQAIRGALRRKLQLAFAADLALYSSHLPLDAHPTLGNNALLAKLVGLKKPAPAFYAKGQTIGLAGEVNITRTALVRRLEQELGGRVHLAPGGPEKIRKLAICSGGSGGEVAEAVRLGCDTFLCGEGPHHTYTLAEELGVNLVYAGHYATETLGVKALAAALSKKFRLPWRFIDHPTGL